MREISVNRLVARPADIQVGRTYTLADFFQIQPDVMQTYWDGWSGPDDRYYHLSVRNLGTVLTLRITSDLSITHETAALTGSDPYLGMHVYFGPLDRMDEVKQEYDRVFPPGSYFGSGRFFTPDQIAFQVSGRFLTANVILAGESDTYVDDLSSGAFLFGYDFGVRYPSLRTSWAEDRTVSWIDLVPYSDDVSVILKPSIGSLFTDGDDNLSLEDLTFNSDKEAAALIAESFHHALNGNDWIGLPSKQRAANLVPASPKPVVYDHSLPFHAGGGADSIFGLDAADIVLGGDGNDNLVGGLGQDSLHGENGADTLFGGGQDDSLNGGDDDDRLFGGLGADTLSGGKGNDVFVLPRGANLAEPLILDPEAGDVIEIPGASLLGPVTGRTPAGPAGGRVELEVTADEIRLHIGGTHLVRLSGIFAPGDFKIEGSLIHILPLFTYGEDEVDFNNLSDEQRRAVEGGAELYSALDGDDKIILPAPAVAAEIGFDFARILDAGAGADIIDFQAYGLGVYGKSHVLRLDGGGDAEGADPAKPFANPTLVDTIWLPGSPDEYTFLVEYLPPGSPQHEDTRTIIHARSPAAPVIETAGFERVVFEHPGLRGENVKLDWGSLHAEMARLTAEVYGPQPTLFGRVEEPLAGEAGWVPAQTAYVAEAAGLRNWHKVSALELGLLPGDFGHFGSLQYAFQNGFYQAVDKTAVPAIVETTQANALVLSGVVNGLKTLAVVFRGTDQGTDFADYPNFRTAHYAKFEPLVDALSTYVASHPIDQVLVAGHSLGAGVAQHFAGDIAPLVHQTKLFTFGSPGAEAPAGVPQVNFVHTDDAVANVISELSRSALGKTALVGVLGAITSPVLGLPTVAMGLATAVAATTDPKERSGFDVRLNSDIWTSGILPYDLQFAEHAMGQDNVNRVFGPGYVRSVRKLVEYAKDPVGPFGRSDFGVALATDAMPANPPPQIAIGNGTLAGGVMHTIKGDRYVLGDRDESDTIIWKNADFWNDGFREIDGGGSGAEGADELHIPGYWSAFSTPTPREDHYELSIAGRVAAKLYRIDKLIAPGYWERDLGSARPESVDTAGADAGHATSAVGNFVIRLDGLPTTVQVALPGATRVTADGSGDIVHAGAGVLELVAKLPSVAALYGGDTHTVRVSGKGSVVASDGTRGPLQATIDTAGGRVVVYGGPRDEMFLGYLAGASFDGGSGFNTVDYRGVAQPLVVNLPGGLAQGAHGGSDRLTSISMVHGSSSAPNELVASIGAATLHGGAAADSLVGQQGDDHLHGHAGNDLLHGGNGADSVIGGTGNDSLNGGSGADTLSGGTGNDTYVVDDAGDVVIETGPGTDLVLSAVAFSLAGHRIENLTLTGTANVNATGNSLDNHITGNAGHNRLNGGSGADTLAGGLGNDTYVVDNAGDVVIETGPGTDHVLASVSFNLSGQRLEHLTLTGTADINGTGNSLDNRIAGNAGHNRLNGGSGADTLSGGLGNDTYVVDHAGDLVIELAGEGTDLVQSFVNHVLAADVENLILAGTADLAGTGNALGNLITGNAGANALSGGAGDDVLRGGAGADTLVGGLGADTMEGGADADHFRFVTRNDSARGVLDRIMDFEVGVDDLVFSAATLFSGLAPSSVAFQGVLNVAAAELNAPGMDLMAQVMTGLNAAAGGWANLTASGAVLNVWQVNVAAGTAAGSYVFVNNATPGASTAGDMLIRVGLVGGAAISATDLVLA